MHGTVEFEVKDGIGLLYLNRPERLNAINMEMVSDLVEVLTRCSADTSVRTIVITGRGRAFCAGADVRELLEMPFAAVVRGGHLPLWQSMRTVRKPIIAALNGVTAGGGLELAMACDIAMAARSAKLGQPEVNLGIIPGAGGTQRLTRAVGKQKAMEMVLTGRMIDAEEAASLGLVLRVVEDGALMDETLSLAHQISSHSSFAVELAKESVNAAFETPLQTGLDLERRNFYTSITHFDGQEGMRAFLEKRKAEWRD